MIFLLLPLAGKGQIDFVSFLGEESKIVYARDCMEMKLVFEVKAGYHIQAHQVQEHLIPSEIRLTSQATSIQQIRYPAAKPMRLTAGETLQVFDGRFSVYVYLDPPSPSSTFQKNIAGILSYQACNDRKCFFPRKLDFFVES